MLHLERNMQTINHSVRRTMILIGLAIALPGASDAAPVPTLKPGSATTAGIPGVTKPGLPALKPAAPAEPDEPAET